MAFYPKAAIRDGLAARRGQKRWRNKNKAEFLLRLGGLLQQGYSLVAGIEFLKYHQKEEVRTILDDLSGELRLGEPLHEVLEDLGFPNDVLAYLYFSEQHGDLAFALTEGGKMMERREQLKIRVRKIVRYPLFLLWIVTVLVIFMTRFLFPQFRSLYDSLNVDFPWFTDVFLTLVDAVPVFFAGLFILLFAGFLFYMTRFRHLHPHAQLSYLRYFPLLHSFLPIIITQYFSVQLSYLLKGGLSIYESLTIFENQHHLAFFQQEATQMKQALRNGERFDDVLRRNSFYVKELPEVIAHGQTNGNLGHELFHYSNLLLEMIEARLQRVFAVIQPALFAGIGSVVLILFISILLPIFHLLDSM
ncbi:MAG TPA: competence type IV pilus assembly protein ComGB [Bacillales bacterium]